jgi:glycine/D-amino acid oxidase-like deaminating enzyme
LAEHYDVVIAGGAGIGSAVAYFLAAEPSFTGSILVVERDPSYEFCSSSRATGGIRQQFSTPENIAMTLFGAAFMKAIGQHLAVDGEAPDIGFRENGYLLLATPAQLPILSANHAVQRAHGAEITFLPPDRLKARFPWLNVDDLAGGFFGERNEGWFDPHALVMAFRRKARALGVHYVADEVMGLVRDGTRITGVTLRAGGRIDAGAVVNAAGARDAAKVARMAGVDLPVEPRKRCAFIVSSAVPIPPNPLILHTNGAGCRPEGKHLLCVISPPEDADPPTEDFDVDYALFEDAIWPELAARSPVFESLKLIRAYCCHYDYNTLDQNALIGLYPGLANFYVATGFSGHGIMQAPATGRAVAELVTFGGYRTLDLARFGVERIFTGAAIRETGVY